MGPAIESATQTSTTQLIQFGRGTVRPRVSGESRTARSTPPRARPLKYGKWRALALASVYLLFGVHIAHWKLNGNTLAPLELNEVMYTLEVGVITAGFLLMATLFVATAVVGRFFCSWACHILALEDLCSWLLARVRIHPRPVRSRLLLLIPPAALFYMFVWPQILRIVQGRAAPEFRILTDEDGWASFVTNDFWRNLPDPWIAGLTFAVCGFAVVYFLGSRSFCLHACPYGAVFAAVDRIAPGRIKLVGHCEQCEICTAVCSSHVRVHEEIARFGKIVDANCMKDLDCVSACPQQALGFGFTKVTPLDSFSKVGRRRLNHDFSRTEELIMGAMFIAVLVVFRGLYTAIPFLMTLGLGGIVAYLSVLCVRLVTLSDVRLSPLRLKRAGRLTGQGQAFCVAMIVFGMFFTHSAYIRYHEARGQRAFDTVQRALQRSGAVVPLDSLHSAIRHLGSAREWGLLRPLVRDHQLASLHLYGADPNLAEPYLRRIVLHEPQDSDSRLALARLLAQSSRLEEAEIEAGMVVAAATTDRPLELAGGYALLGSIHEAQGEAQAAIEAYRTAAAQDAASVSVRMALGRLLVERERFVEAAGVFREASALQPDLPVAFYNLGAALSMSGDEPGAIEAYRKALVLLPDDVQTLTNLGFLRARRGELSAAVELFQHAIELRPDRARLHFNLARVHQSLGDLALAQRHYRLAGELDPKYAQPPAR